MKHFIFLFLVLVTVPSQAQITVEHKYVNHNRRFGLVEVDSGVFKYVIFNRLDSIYIHNLDHSLDRIITFPKLDVYTDLEHISKRLFDVDDAYECLISTPTFPYKLRVFKENGDSLFGCDGCSLNTANIDFGTNIPPPIVNTGQGVKMLVEDNYLAGSPTGFTVYSLPGKLPGGTAKSGVNAPSIVSGNSFPTSAYPNPSNGQMRISYKLPLGESTGELVILSTDGIEVKRYKVGYGFNDILVEKSDLPSGSYFYKLVTEKGESETQKLIILK